jgi:hypothetical protein
MMKKTILFQMPKTDTDAETLPAPERKPSLTVISAEDWVHQEELVLETPVADDKSDDAIAPSSVNGAISNEPNWYDAAKLAYLPSLTFWLWTLEATQKNLRLLTR